MNFRIVKTKEDLAEMLEELNAHDLVAFDTETTGLNVRKDSIMGLSFSTMMNSGWYFPRYNYDVDIQKLVEMPFKNEFTKVLSILKTKLLVMHNGSFDCLIVDHQYNIDLTPNLFIDTIMLKHTVDEENPFKLKEIACKHYAELGFSSKEDANLAQVELKESVVKNGGTWKKEQKEMYKADLDILGKYAAVDTDLTLRLLSFYGPKLIEEGTFNLFFNEEVMPLYREVTIPMIKRGVKLNLEKLKEYHRDICKDLTELQSNFQQEIAPEVKKLLPGLLAKKCPVFSPTGKLKYDIASIIIERCQLELPKTPSGKYSLSQKILENARTDHNQEIIDLLIKGKDSLTSRGLVDELFDIQKEVFLRKKEYFINITSKDDLILLYIDTMEEQPLSRTDKGKPQMDKNMITFLSEKYESAKFLFLYNKLNKIKTSYFDRMLRENEDSIWYPTYKQFGTISGRYSGDFQQLPKPSEEDDDTPDIVRKYTDIVRELVISREGYSFIDTDYNSLEVVIFGDDAGDEALVKAISNGEDIYSRVGIEVNESMGLLEKGKFSADKKADNFLKKHKPTIRQQAKAYTLGIRYGLGDFKLSHDLGIEQEDAQIIIENYFNTFPKLKNAMEKYKKQAVKDGKVINRFNRIRHVPFLKQWYERFGEALFDPFKTKMLAKRCYKSFEEMRTIRRKCSNLLNNAYNFPIQSAAGSIINRASIAIARYIKEHNVNAFIIAQVHDQLIIECEDDTLSDLKKVVQDLMENTTKLTHLELGAPPEISKNMRDGH